MAKIKYTTRKIEDLVLNDDNPRTIDLEGMETIKKSLTELGQLDPILININKDRKNVVLSGNQRLRAMIELGWKECDVAEVDIPLNREKAVVLMMNNHQGSWDDNRIAKYIEEAVKEDGIDYQLTGFTENEKAKYLDRTISEEVQ